MGDVAVEHSEASVEAAPEPAARAAGAALSLTPAGVRAPQGGAGNRAVGRMLAIARTPSVSDEVFRVTQELNKKQPPDKATIDDAVAVAGRAWAEVGRLKSASSPNQSAIEDAYREVQRVVGSLIDNKAENAAIDFAKGTDATVQTGALNSLRGHYQGVANQQQFATKAGRLAGVTIPAAGASQSSAAWLEAQTEKVGEAFKKLDAMGLKGLSNDPTSSLSLALVSELLKQYFSHEPDDVKPDPMGKIGKLTVDASNQLEADCDIYATYGARLLRAAGWATVGYMAIVPEDPGRDAHAVSLAKRASASGGNADYVSLSNWELKQFTAATDDAAKDSLLAHGLAIYAAKGEPNVWKAYYSAAGTGGAYDLKLLDPAKHKLPIFKQKP